MNGTLMTVPARQAADAVGADVAKRSRRADVALARAALWHCFAGKAVAHGKPLSGAASANIAPQEHDEGNWDYGHARSPAPKAPPAARAWRRIPFSTAATASLRRRLMRTRSASAATR